MVVDPDRCPPRSGARSARPSRGRASRPTREAEVRSRSRARIASSSDSTVTIGTTGPKISSRMIRMSCVTSGQHGRARRTRRPRSPGTSTGPPQRSSAPFATASSTSSLTSSYCSRRDHRADLGVAAQRVADAQRLRAAHDAVDERARPPPRRRRRARCRRRSGPALAKPPQRQPETAFSRLASAQTICASLPPSSSTEPLSRSAQAIADLAADVHRAGEEDLRRARLDQRVADGAAAVDHADEALGQAGAHEHVADALADQRRQRRGLEHDAVAGHQRDRDLAERDRPRVVPGRDHADDAERLVGEDATSSAW